MENVLSARWVGNIGSSLYTEYLRQGKVDRFYLVTVTMENAPNNSSPTDKGSKVVMNDEDIRTTRTSKCPWVMLQEIICGINSTTITSQSKKRKRSQSNKKKSKLIYSSTQPINNLSVDRSTVNNSTVESSLKPDYFKFTEARIGPYRHDKVLQIGDVQTFVFSETDEGPFYLQNKEGRRYDVENGNTRRDLTKTELEDALRTINVNGKGNKKQLQELCRPNNIPTKIEIPKVVEGWVGKAKGTLQILWERGWIDMNNLPKYTNDGKVDAFGILDTTYSLQFLVSNLKDFLEEESMLQSMGNQMGIKIDRTPICHAELAGEGIEYSWGCSKNKYRTEPLSKKKVKETYRELVKKCISRDNLTTERVRKFSRRARSYICAYYQMHYADVNPDASVPEQVKIEQLAKSYKTHRSVVDFNYGFITSVVKSTQGSE